VNGGFFVFEPGIFGYLSADEDVLETAALSRLAADGQTMAYRHQGFWQCMDTVPERNLLEQLWRSGSAPWSTNYAPACNDPALVDVLQTTASYNLNRGGQQHGGPALA
jgi:NDP-sugar pyrophosphorylase family protein